MSDISSLLKNSNSDQRISFTVKAKENKVLKIFKKDIERSSQSIDKQIEFVTSQSSLNGPKNVLVIGSSTGYGLASRIMSAFGSGANTVGVFFERPGTNKRTASSGWYNTAAFEDRAIAAGLGTWSINGDAFSNEIKEQTIEK